ncbi:MAG: hydrogenase expression/formation protein HypE [Phycisphaeraceae bacterium]|nr:hydrogenase expression/formation protein HypE [Phycisphaeraceae bacterium]
MSLPERIMLAHGGGGQLTDDLIGGCILPRLGNEILNELLDAAEVGQDGDGGRLAVTIDSHVVEPWRFPGGDIGRLAVCGTVNDLAVCGARPVGLALSLIITEGFARVDLEEILDSLSKAAGEAGVAVVTGDTKVIGHNGQAEIYITTAGVGRIPRERKLSPKRIQAGDVILINGPIGDHGLAVMLARQMPEVTSPVRSDVAALNGLIELMLRNLGDEVAFMRDPTRGGVAALTAEAAMRSGAHVVLNEEEIPVQPCVLHAAEMLGLDVLEVANEGKVVLFVRPSAAEAALALMRAHPLGQGARRIGQVTDDTDGICELRTRIGGRRVIQKPYGEQLPRIC